MSSVQLSLSVDFLIFDFLNIFVGGFYNFLRDINMVTGDHL